MTPKHGYVTNDGNRPHRFSKGQGFDKDYSDFSLDLPESSVDPTKVDLVDSRILTDVLDRRNIDPEDTGVEGLLNMALSYIQINRFEEATGAFERVARYTDDDDNVVQKAWVNKSAVHDRLEEWDEVIGSYRGALELDDDSEHAATTHTNLAYALREAGQTADMLGHVERAVELDPCFPQTWYDRGSFFYERDLNEDAINAFDNAIRLGMRTSDAYKEKARTFEEPGHGEEAEQAQQQADGLRERAEAELVEEYQILLRGRETPEGLLVSVRDPDCTGEIYINNGVSLDVAEDFYGGGEAKTASEDAVVDNLTHATVADIIGKRSVSVIIDASLAGEEAVLEVDGTLHAQLP